MHHATSLRLVCDIAERQGWDVVAAYSFEAMPRFGQRQTTAVLMHRSERSLGDRHEEYRVTDHMDSDSEFGDGFYTHDRDAAIKRYESKCGRYNTDRAIHEDPSVWSDQR